MSERIPRNLCRGCGCDFSSVKLFDDHRVGKHEYLYDAWDDSKADGRRCLGVEEMQARGWEPNERGLWTDPARNADAARRLRRDASLIETTKAVRGTTTAPWPQKRPQAGVNTTDVEKAA